MVKSGMHQELRVSPLTNCSPGEAPPSRRVPATRARSIRAVAQFIAHRPARLVDGAWPNQRPVQGGRFSATKHLA